MHILFVWDPGFYYPGNNHLSVSLKYRLNHAAAVSMDGFAVKYVINIQNICSSSLQQWIISGDEDHYLTKTPE